jgi:predicted ATPase
MSRLLEHARLGVSGAVVVGGEPGVGKTALLLDTLERATDLTVLRATGWEAERNLPFSGLLQLLRPVLPLLDDLAAPQAAALAGALGLGPASGREAVAETGDRFMIGAAVLDLLSRCAERGPVVVAVDDLHAMDLPSVEALVFAARRLTNDPVALVATARSPEVDHLVAGLPQVRLTGLDEQAARDLVARGARRPVVADRLGPLLDLAGGNPLALLELADDADALATEPSNLPFRVPDTVAAAFARRLEQLDADARTAVLVAAVCAGDLPVITRACGALGVEQREGALGQPGRPRRLGREQPPLGPGVLTR